MSSSDSQPVLHVLVVGFHHKKGCQVEYSYPPLMPDGDPHSNELPSQWKHLPSLALPDGSHNFTHDTTYFHLPALDNPRQTIFAISCYRQISADALVNRTSDITRGSVQKCVCVLSRLPLYGQIQVKMSLITEAYFREGDFTRLDLIHQTYDNLNACLSDDMLHTQQLYVGLSAREFVQKFRQKTLILFKLMLLERKVLFMQSPVNELCTFFLTLLSLHPGMLEKGLNEAARMVPVDTPPSTSPIQDDVPECHEDDKSLHSKGSEEDVNSVASATSSIVEIAGERVASVRSRISGAFGYIAGQKPNSSDSISKESTNEESIPSTLPVEEAVNLPNFQTVANLPMEIYGLPLNIFTGGNLCHPYLSLSYLDVLVQPSIHGYMIGATNILFRQKKGIAEVVIDIDKDKLEILDPELKRALTLTTEDLRFIDNVVKHASEGNKDVFLDQVGWEGGDEWVRAQFRFYMVCLLRTSLESLKQHQSKPQTEGAQESVPPCLNHFNPSFIQQWRKTKNYQHWINQVEIIKAIKEDVPLGHPFAGHLSVTDMKLHFSNSISNTESGRRVSQAVTSTGRAMAGGITSARGAFSSWLDSFKQPPVDPEQATEVTDSGVVVVAEEAVEKATNP